MTSKRGSRPHWQRIHFTLSVLFLFSLLQAMSATDQVLHPSNSFGQPSPMAAIMGGAFAILGAFCFLISGLLIARTEPSTAANWVIVVGLFAFFASLLTA